MKILPFIFLLSGYVSHAQSNNHPTQFDKFVNKSKIQWATYSSDSFYFDKLAFNELLINRLAENNIKASLPINSRTEQANHINYLTKDAIDREINPPAGNETRAYDSNGNVMPVVFKSTALPEKYINNITEVTQILFIEKGKLKSYIPWVTPTLPVILSDGKYMGESYYFNTAYNYRYCYTSRKKSKLVYLGRTKKMITADQSLKKMYGKNLLESLWPGVLNNEIDLYTITSNVKINPAELDKSVEWDDPVLSPIYNANGAISKFEVFARPVDLQRFTEIELVQDWYYDARKNKLTNSIKEAWLYAKIRRGNQEAKKATPVLKLVFK